MFEHRSRAWLTVGDGIVVPWSFGGYGERERVPSHTVDVLTPPSTVAALAVGYRPRLHPSVVRAPTTVARGGGPT
jgi:hypothetical protein